MGVLPSLWQGSVLPVLTWLVRGVSDASGQLWVGIVVVTVLVRLALSPVARWARRPRSRFARLVGLLVAVVQYPIVVGLSLALRHAATELGAGTGRGFLWVDDLNRSPLDVCCATGGSVRSGLVDTPSAIALLVLAAAGALALTALTRRRPDPSMPLQQRRNLRASGHVSALSPLSTVAFGLLLPQAAALSMLTQTGYAVAEQQLRKRRLPTRRPLPAMAGAAP